MDNETDVIPIDVLANVVRNGETSFHGKSITEGEAVTILGTILLTDNDRGKCQAIEHFFLERLQNPQEKKETKFSILVLFMDLSSLISEEAFDKLAEFESDSHNTELVLSAREYLKRYSQ